MFKLVAMESKPFKIYSASAGSGKTFTLVKEYLKICLIANSPNKYVEILAITFTNKAAAEMKDRIIKSLKAFSNPEKASQTEIDMMKMLVEETNLSLDELQTKSKLIFETILHNYAQFSIGTIDKFTHRIIRTFAQDLDLPANFEVEMEHQILLKQAVDLLISRTGEDEELTELFVNFIQDKTADDKSWLIENDFYNIAEELLKESGQEHCESLKNLSLSDFFSLKEAIHNYLNNFDNELSDLGKKFNADCLEKGLDSSWFTGGARSGISKYFEYLKNKTWKSYIPSNANLKNFEKDTWYAGKAPKEYYGEIDSIQEKYYPLLKKALELLEAYPKYVQFKLIAQNFYSMAVLHEISKELQQIKEQNNIIPIGEFNKKIAEVLQNEEGDFIYERLGERYANYFIDEFQDTSELQWKNLLPLVENAIADGLKPGTAMLVGDAKQAIYRWRGGEVDQFIDLQLQAADSSSQKAYKMESLNLPKNYRSASEVVHFNNQLFSSIAQQIDHEKYRDLFKGLNAIPEKGEGGYVSIEYVENGESYDELQKQKCLQSIHELIEEGFNYGDICVLTRTKAKGALIVQMLSDENIPVISSESLLIEQSTEVRFLLNFLRFLNDPKHPRYRFKLIEFLHENEWIPASLESVNMQLEELCNVKLDRFNQFLEELIQGYNFVKWRSISLIELSHRIIKSFQLEKSARVYMQFFLDELWVFCNKYSQDLYGFLNYWDERAHKLSIAVPEGINAVQVMTIHKSKGLEFPIVLFPFANWNATSERDAKSWIDIDEPELEALTTSLIPLGKQLESSTNQLKEIYKEHKAKVLLDNLNMLYVALTRPKTRLYIFTSPKERGKNLNEFFDTFLQTNGDWQEGKTIYAFGEKVRPSQKQFEKNKEIFLADPIDDLSKILRISRQAPTMWEVDNPEKGADKGRKVHEILSYIKSEDDVNAAIEKALRQGLITNKEELEMKNVLERIIGNQDVKIYFKVGLKVKNEEEILLKNGEVIRPDRLVFYEDGVSIIDYKTGEHNPSHEEQILKYKVHIEDMDYKVRECVLIYVNNETVELKRV
jgi:ATP-dependent exoDNAse (exonuclease V) beta subunit